MVLDTSWITFLQLGMKLQFRLKAILMCQEMNRQRSSQTIFGRLSEFDKDIVEDYDLGSCIASYNSLGVYVI